MNKLLIVILAVCLFSVVSAHAFVKRDAPTSAADDMTNKLSELAKDVKKKIDEVVNQDAIKKTFNDFVDGVNKTIQNLTPTPATDAKPAA